MDQQRDFSVKSFKNCFALFWGNTIFKLLIKQYERTKEGSIIFSTTFAI